MSRNHWERSLPGEKGAKGEMGEPGIGERGEPGPAGPIGNNQTYLMDSDHFLMIVAVTNDDFVTAFLKKCNTCF